MSRTTNADNQLVRRPATGRLIAVAAGWISGLDGGLLTDEAWTRRHRVVAGLATVNAVVAIAIGASAPHNFGLWIQAGALVAALAVAWTPSLSRRPRELAMVCAFLLCAAVQNHFGANFSSLSGAYVLLIAVYQDWLPLAAALIGVLVLPFLAIFSPHTLAEWKSFQRETPTTGALVRTLGVYVAAGVAVLVWRANGVAARDGLTGLATREHAERRLSQALRNERRPCVLVGDIDAFHLAADDLPRASSDELIRQIGLRLRDIAQGDGQMLAAGGGARYIGVRLADTDAVEAAALARRWCEAIAGEPFLSDGAEIPMTISVGVSLGQPGDAASDLLRAAEVAMRRAKWGGDPAIAFAEQEMAGLRPRAAGPITAELRRALQDDELVMHYQPLVKMSSGEIVGAEALVRWQHPTRGLLGPGEFLPAAETHPWLNAQISRAIGTKAFRQIARWDAELPGRLPMGVAINLAPTRLKDPALRESLHTALAETGADPARVTLEITEGALMDLDVDAPAALMNIADLGLRIALDDFGTGHSSLARLRDFPPHEIKIDRAFVSGILESDSDRAVVSAVLVIAAQFGAVVVVEGIDTEEQRRAILAMRPDVIGQGFYFARPMPASDLTELLREETPLPRPDQ